VIGTTYGAGNGSTTFNLPNMAGRVAVGQGSGSGLTPRSMGATGGSETHSLTTEEMPSHSHDVSNTVQKSGANTPDGLDNGGNEIDTVTTVTTASASVGDSEPHNNVQPFVVLNYIIKH
jgi:microcystin-dependent protein